MIVVHLSGGLGNQLFQYAAGRRLAQVRDTELVLDLSWYARTPRSDTPRTYELSRYAIQARVTTPGEALWCRLHEGPILRRLDRLPRRWKHYREKSIHFDPAVLTLPDDVYLDGCWQSHRYFDDMDSLIRSELTLNEPMRRRDQEMADQIAATASIAVHVRRGDYVTHQAAIKKLGVCSPEYYEQAFAHILGRVATPHFFVFSDDPEWVRASMHFPGRVTVVAHNGPAEAVQDLRLLSLCKHQVTANSSFSWWGAWLNGSRDKIVVTPKQWFAELSSGISPTPATWQSI